MKTNHTNSEALRASAGALTLNRRCERCKESGPKQVDRQSLGACLAGAQTRLRLRCACGRTWRANVKRDELPGGSP